MTESCRSPETGERSRHRARPLPAGARLLLCFQAFNASGNAVAFGAPLILLARSLGADNWQVSVLTSLASLAIVVQPFSTGLLERIGYRRSLAGGWTATAFLLAAVAVLPLVPGRESVAVGALLALMFAIQTIRSFSQLAWFPWLARFLPAEQRGRFFGCDVLVAAAAGFVGLLAAGWILGEEPGAPDFVLTYGVIAVFAVIAGGIAFKVPGGERAARTSEPSIGMLDAARELLSRRSFRRVLAFVAAYNAFLSPVLFVLVLLQRDLLHLGAREILILQAAAQTGIVLASTMWGRASDRFGTRPVLRFAAGGTLAVLCGWGVCPILDPGFAVLVALGVALGTFQAAHGVGMMGLLMRTCSRRFAPQATALFQGTAALAAAATPPVAGAILSGKHGTSMEFAAVLALVAMTGIAAQWMLGRVPEPGRIPTREAVMRVGGRLHGLVWKP